MFAMDLSIKIFSPPRHKDTKFNYNKHFFFVSWCLCGYSFRFFRVGVYFPIERQWNRYALSIIMGPSTQKLTLEFWPASVPIRLEVQTICVAATIRRDIVSPLAISYWLIVLGLIRALPAVSGGTTDYSLTDYATS